MTSKERMMAAVHRQTPDRLPVTVHQWQPYHLQRYMHGMSDIEANAACGFDAAITRATMVPRRTDQWRISESRSRRPGDDYDLIDYTIETPEGILTTQSGTNDMTTWVTKHLICEPEDIHLLKKYHPVPLLDRAEIVATHEVLGDGGILRSFVTGAQGSCWQDACELVGTEALIMATFDDPEWVHELLGILLGQKLQYIEESMPGLPIDLVETGGGAGSNTVISPAIHEAFCLPYDQKLHAALHALGYPVVYHTCGGMAKITHLIVQNGCDASETLSPAGVGGDITSEAVARQIYDDLHSHVGLIGGMDQFHLLELGTPEQIAAEVRRLFDLFGPEGGYILSASDHFFNAPPENLRAMGDAAHACIY